MRKLNNWKILAGILLIMGGVVIVWVTIRKNLPSPFDIASASGGSDYFLPLIAPASGGDISGSATRAGAPTVDAGESFTPEATPQARPVGMTPDRMAIPVINLDTPILPVNYKTITVSDKVYYQWLAPDEYAVGWQDSSALLGVPGNTVLNGHHNAYGQVFKDLVKLEIGDVISVYSGAQEFRYRVVAKMLLPERFTPLETRLENARWIEPSADQRITLVTCWPADSNTHRVIIVAFPIESPSISSGATQMTQSPEIIICYNNTTMTVNQSALDQYSNYTEGACSQETSGLTVKKSVTESSYTLVGDHLHYIYIVTNIGNMALNGVVVSDDKTTVACPKTTLEPAESMTCTAIYIVKNADLANEDITNTTYAAAHASDTLVKSPIVSQTVMRFIKLILSAKCAEDPAKNSRWTVENKNSYPLGYEYAIDGGVAGVGTVPANSTISFDTPVGSGTGVMSLYVDGLLQNNATAVRGCK